MRSASSSTTCAAIVPHFRYNISMNGYVLEWTPEGKLTDRRATDEEMDMSIKEFYKVYNGYEE